MRCNTQINRKSFDMKQNYKNKKANQIDFEFNQNLKQL
jgi:hypothetical protein